MDDIDDEEMREIREKVSRRGHAAHFDWRDKETKELGIVRTFLESAPLIYDAQVVQPNRPDPPDCIIVDRAKGKVGVEVTELVDQKAIERDASRPRETQGSEWPVWDQGTFVDVLGRQIESKGNGRPHGGPFGEYVLLVHTDEPGLRPVDVSRWLEGVTLGPRGMIDRAFLLFSYMPGSGNRVLEVPLRPAGPSPL